MGLPPTLLHKVIRLHVEQPFADPLLTLGVQDIMATYDELRQIFALEHVVPCEVPQEEQLSSTSINFSKCGFKDAGFAHARTFFRMLGIKDYCDLDGSAAEGPQLVHDLNQPVPREWHNRFGSILDPGTLEHIIDVRAALANIVAMLRVGGTIMHISPLSGWINHGFIQVSPCLYFDFYQENGFRVRDAAIVRLLRANFRAAGQIVPYKHKLTTFSMDDREYASCLAFTATKLVPTESVRNPVQSKYRPRFAGSAFAPAS